MLAFAGVESDEHIWVAHYLGMRPAAAKPKPETRKSDFASVKLQSRLGLKNEAEEGETQTAEE